MTPSKFSSAPIGTCIGTGFAPRRAFSWSTTLSKSAPMRSILLTNARRGTPYLLAWRQTVSDCGCTPPTAQNTNTAPSSTRKRTLDFDREVDVSGRVDDVEAVLRNERSMPVQKQVVAADVIVMPRSCSCSIQSMVAAPSCTSPILWLTPV